jgi:hypothetical protein
MKALIIAVIASAGITAFADETRLGTGVTLKESTPIAKLTVAPRDFVGKTIRVDGVATAVCEMMGCWMAVAPEGEPSGTTVRLKVEDGVIVFPVSAKGKKVSAEGVFEVVGSDGDSAEAAGEHAQQDAKASTRYQLKATGAIIR